MLSDEQIDVLEASGDFRGLADELRATRALLHTIDEAATNVIERFASTADNGDDELADAIDDLDLVTNRIQS